MGHDTIDASMRAALLSEYQRITLERVERLRSLAGESSSTSELLRELHTVKGEAMMMGERQIGTLAQRMEELVLGGARDFQRELLTTITEIASMIRSMTSRRHTDDPAE
jgi:chemotaxis protein histidine kinase CheA